MQKASHQVTLGGVFQPVPWSLQTFLAAVREGIIVMEQKKSFSEIILMH